MSILAIKENGVLKYVMCELKKQEYEVLESIESTKTQYFDIGFSPSNNHMYEIDFELLTNATGQSIFGKWLSTSTDTARLIMYSNMWYFVDGKKGQLTLANMYNPQRRYCVYNNYDNGATLDDVSVDLNYAIANPTEGNIYLFCCNRGSAMEFSQMKLYSFKIIDKSSGETLQDLIPVRRLSDNLVTLYDKISNSYLEVLGSGDFIAHSKESQTYNPRYCEIKAVDKNTTLLLKSRNGEVIDISKNHYEITNYNAVVNEQGFTLGASSGFLETSYDCFNNEGDFTIEWIENCQGNANSVCAIVYAGYRDKINTSDRNGWGGFLFGYGGNVMYAGTAMSNWNVISSAAAKSRENFTDVYWAIQRNGSTFTSYRNGVKFYEITPSNGNSVLYRNETANFYIGDYTNADGYNAIIKEFKISKIARYGDSYTPSIEIFGG